MDDNSSEPSQKWVLDAKMDDLMRLFAASQEAKETQLQHVSYIKPQDTWLKFSCKIVAKILANFVAALT